MTRDRKYKLLCQHNALAQVLTLPPNQAHRITQLFDLRAWLSSLVTIEKDRLDKYVQDRFAGKVRKPTSDRKFTLTYADTGEIERMTGYHDVAKYLGLGTRTLQCQLSAKGGTITRIVQGRKITVTRLPPYAYSED